MVDPVTNPENQVEAVEAVDEQAEVEEMTQPDNGQDQAADEAASDEPEEPYEWQASEYIQHHKGVVWYVGLFSVVAALLVIAVIMKIWLSIGVFLAMAAAIVVYAKKPPRVLAYHVDDKGIKIEGKDYPYATFRSFSVVSEEEWHSIDLEPVQRFVPRLSLLFGDDDFDAIVTHLVRHLPRDDRDPDLIERFSRYLRF
jgi:hypothetical protein